MQNQRDDDDDDDEYERDRSPQSRAEEFLIFMLSRISRPRNIFLPISFCATSGSLYF